MKIETLYDVGDKVIIDDCRDIVAVITECAFTSQTNIVYKVSWIQDGTMREPWIQEWRLDKWDA